MSEEKNIELLSPEWAIAEIIHYAGSELSAKQMLADGLRSGKLRLMANYVWGSDVGDLQDDWEPRAKKGHVYYEDVEVEAGNFALSSQWPKDTNYWRWDKGEFVILLSEDEEGWGRFDRIYIKGAYFFKDELMGLFGRSKRGGGRKADRDRWAMFWINVLRSFVGNEFDWTQYESPRELKQAFIAANEHAAAEVGSDGKRYTFSDNNLDFAVDLAWEHLVKHAAREAVRQRRNRISDE